MSSRTRLIIAFVISCLSAIVLACFSHTQLVLNELASLGVSVPAEVRARATLDDLLGLLPTYGVIITIGLAIAFALTAWLLRKFSLSPRVLYPLAGAVAFAAMLLLMHPILEITLIAGARGWSGFMTQCLCGLAAGLCFAFLKESPRTLAQ
ncbi:hypothetical protein MIB92_06470 [Aestuariirhabdus sp. Z084]|uniref:hypothetical protein n=1 Tax=Aestuariirhabdus haliotis TaxID=2918751 RepID=UPI00201B4206|nr:hypothetical protein [Aestuariirhabdus haliotis]MCL6415287.1 hypothetical protein [Aestuariirhabdus haliotis]MCL6419547.1 hypothetical protein [Aestuariirhabdus haliotis]